MGISGVLDAAQGDLEMLPDTLTGFAFAYTKIVTGHFCGMTTTCEFYRFTRLQPGSDDIWSWAINLVKNLMILHL